MFDTHCHLTFDAYENRVGEVLDAAREAGVRGVITVATTTADALRSRALAEAHENVWFSAGVHPLHADEPRNWPALKEAAGHAKCVAFGELGLDNHYREPAGDVQRRVLTEQLEVLDGLRSDGVEKPIILHCREAFDDLLAVLREAPFDPERYVFHCFTGGRAEARKVLDFGAWISFTGVVTFPNAPEVAEAAKLVPGDRLMVETDAPFLTPAPHRGVRPNEPKYVVHTARKLAEIRGEDRETFEARLDENARRFFGVG